MDKEIDVEGVTMFMKEPEQIPHWMVMSKDVAENQKNGKKVRWIDKATVKEIWDMYQSGILRCDECGKPDPNLSYKHSAQDHVIHAINSCVWWSCNNCMFEAAKRGEFLFMTLEEAIREFSTLKKDWKCPI